MISRHLHAIVVSACAAALALTAQGGAWAQCSVVVNGCPLGEGAGICDDHNHLLLTADALIHGLGLTVAQDSPGGPWTVRGFGRSVVVRPDNTSYQANGELRSADACPVLRDGAPAVPLEMLREVFAIEERVYREYGTSVHVLTTPGVDVTDVRQGSHDDSVRLVIDLSAPTGFTWSNERGVLVVELPAPREEGAQSRSVRLLRFDDPLASELRQGPTVSGTVRIEIAHHSELPPAVFTLADPPRVVIDLFRRPEDVHGEPAPTPIMPLPIAAGVLETRNFSTPRGPMRVYVINVDPRSDAIDIRPMLAASTVHERSTVARMVASAGAWGGVNGGFFSYEGPPLGMLVIDGEWISEPWPGRTALGITNDGRLLMDRVSFAARIVFAGLGTQKLHALNHGHAEQDTLVMYTQRWGEVVAGAQNRTRLIVDATGVVTHKVTDGSACPIPAGGFVLSGIGRMAGSLNEVPVGTAVSAQLGTNPAWPDLRHAIGGGPRLVQDGRVQITAAAERFRPDVCAGTRSRTAVGITREGRLLLVAVEAASGNGVGAGMSLEELAATMIKLGAWQAMNLDGGGSTTFVADGRVLNRPDDGTARRVSNALLVFTRQVAVATGG